MKIHICGYGAKNRSKENPESTGKDYLAEKLSESLGLSYCGSSEFVAEHLIYPIMKDRYSSWQECFADRHAGDNRKFWHDLIKAYNSEDSGRLAKEIFASYDIYVGIRDRNEFMSSMEICDIAIWVDATKRIEPEDNSSCDVTSAMCDIVIENNGTLEEFDNKIARLARALEGQCILDQVREGFATVEL